MAHSTTQRKKRGAVTQLVRIIRKVVQEEMQARHKPSPTPTQPLAEPTLRVCVPGSADEVLAPPSARTDEVPEHARVIWERLATMGALSKEELEFINTAPVRSKVMERIVLLAEDTNRPVYMVIQDVADFCKVLGKERALNLPERTSGRSAVEGSEDHRIIFTPEQVSRIDRVLYYLRVNGLLGKTSLESMIRDPRFHKVEQLIANLPAAEDTGELTSFANIVVGRINKLFGTNEGGHRDHGSKTPAAYGKALDELAHTTPHADTHTATVPQQRSDFRVRPTLFRGFDQRKWDKILTESSFSIMHKAMRSVLIATEESAEGVQSVRLRAVEGLFLVEVNALYPVCTHYVQNRTHNSKILRDLLSPKGVATDLNDDVAEIAMTLVVIAAVGTTPGIPRIERDQMHLVEEYASDMAMRILGKAVVTGSALAAEMLGTKRARSPRTTHTRTTSHGEKARAHPHTPSFDKRTPQKKGGQNKQRKNVGRCFVCDKAGHKAIDCTRRLGTN